MLPSAAELAAAIRRREVGPVEVLESHVARIEALDPGLNAFAVRDFERARAAARAAEKALAREDAVGPLLGVPVTVKEQFDVAGLPTREASLLIEPELADADAASVACLRKAGAIVLGKTNMSELAMFPDSVNRVYGGTRNPRDPRLSAGGSSGGEACAIATGMSALGLGSDYGGSIRCPAHFCGIFGLRPGLGVIPTAGAAPRVRTAARARLTTVGPLARTVRDLALALDVLAGPLPPAELPLRAGVLAPGAPPDAVCAAAVSRVASTLEELGVRVEEVSPPFRARSEARFDDVSAIETRIALAAYLPERLEDASPQLVAQWQATEHIALDLPRYSRLLTELHALEETADDWLRTVPLLIAPAASTPAFELGRLDGVFERFADCRLASALGLPALVLPAGRTDEGLPVGVQLVGRRGTEAQLLRVAEALEAALG